MATYKINEGGPMKKIKIILGFVLLAAAVFFGVKFFLDTYSPAELKTEQYGPAPAPVRQGTTQDPSGQLSTDEPSASEPSEEDLLYVDFETLTALNPDIYAWIEIPGTDISYPVVQNPNNDRYYLRTNSDGEYSAGGAIFSEATYNSTDFNDPVTILYGHHMNAGNIMFGHLQDYFTDPDFLSQNPKIRIYTPEGLYEYGVFAAVPFNRDHILYYNDMDDPEVYQAFFNSVLTIRELGVYINEEYMPYAADQDRVLILSTCLAGNNTRRFLVMATLLSDQ